MSEIGNNQFNNEQARANYELMLHGIASNNIIGKSHLIEKLNKIHSDTKEDKDVLRGYFGTAPTSKPHIGYMKPFLKIADLVEAGCEMYILLADVHAFLDSRKSDLEDQNRMLFYKELIIESLKLLNVDITKIHFVVGSSFQYSIPYIQDLLKYADVVTDTQAKHAG